MDMTAVVISVGFITFNMLSLTSHYLDGNILAYVEPLGKLPYLISILYLGILSLYRLLVVSLSMLLFDLEHQPSVSLVILEQF